jgi:predicted nucleic acid-binding protein
MDSNVLVAGACRHAGSQAYRLLCGVLSGQMPLILTPAIALEYEDVLVRPGILALTGLTHGESIDLVTDLIARSLRTQTRFVWRPNLRDEDDNKFVEAAMHTAAIIVTYNEADYRGGDLGRHGWLAMSPDEFLTRYAIREDT